MSEESKQIRTIASIFAQNKLLFALHESLHKRMVDLTLKITLRKSSFIYCTNLILGEVIQSAVPK